MFSFWGFWNFCFQFVSFGTFCFLGVLIFSTLQFGSRFSRRRSWWSLVPAFSSLLLLRHCLCSSVSKQLTCCLLTFKRNEWQQKSRTTVTQITHSWRGCRSPWSLWDSKADISTGRQQPSWAPSCCSSSSTAWLDSSSDWSPLLSVSLPVRDLSLSNNGRGSIPRNQTTACSSSLIPRGYEEI